MLKSEEINALKDRLRQTNREHQFRQRQLDVATTQTEPPVSAAAAATDANSRTRYEEEKEREIRKYKDQLKMKYTERVQRITQEAKKEVEAARVRMAAERLKGAGGGMSDFPGNYM